MKVIYGKAIFRTLAVAVIAVVLPKDLASADETALWDTIRSGGHIVLMRHALAPGSGDPSAFAIGACETQRNLSQQGRLQAKKIGERFRANGITTARVFSSQWCRCLETAKLLKLGPVNKLSVLNSFYGKSINRKPQTRALKKWLAKQSVRRVFVLVTHQVNITALTGIFPISGELVIIRHSGNDKFQVVGTFKTAW